ncbi:hypothetical protein F2P81_004896 [Scophthalmus maximus]|uniref:Asc-type amino acid transporter 1-like n=1 Tax=Scophthalmus maximus TaxID=52904 RepID=A0A6A4TFF9_SCOMX|nr:hypothetical protein F2P81_004896 [Scophthalmus maximus]
MEDSEREEDSKSSKSDRVALKKEIGLLSACAIIIGNIIGSGIFISPKGVLEHAGSVGLSLIVWVCGGGICALGSMCYAELGVTIPKSGGDYSYVTEIFGGLVGFLLLWSAVLIMYPTTLAVIALTFSNYVLQPAFQYCLPPFIATRILATICVCHYDALHPSVAFEFRQDPSVGQIALAFLQASFAYSGWNFLNYVTEEVVEPRKYGTHTRTESISYLYGFSMYYCFATIVILCIGETHNLINYVSFINYLSYGVTIAGLLYLRKKRPNLARPIKVNVLIPITYMVFWAVLLCFSLYSEPVVCGLGMVIMLTGVPVYFVGVYWRNKPKWIHRLVERVTYVGQKVCYVVFPQADPSEPLLIADSKAND